MTQSDAGGSDLSVTLHAATPTHLTAGVQRPPHCATARRRCSWAMTQSDHAATPTHLTAGGSTNGLEDQSASLRRDSVVSIGPSANMVGARHKSSARHAHAHVAGSLLENQESLQMHANSSDWPRELAQATKGKVDDNIERIESEKTRLVNSMPELDREIQDLGARLSTLTSDLNSTNLRIESLSRRKLEGEKKLKIARIGWDLILAAHLETIRYAHAGVKCFDFDCPGDGDSQDPNLGSFVDAHSSVYVLGVAAEGRENASTSIPPLFPL